MNIRCTRGNGWKWLTRCFNPFLALGSFGSGSAGAAVRKRTGRFCLSYGEDGPASDGMWQARVDEDLKGKFYTFNVKIDDVWQGDTPGLMAKAVGVNGDRAAVIDWKETNPEGWNEDKRPPLKRFSDMVIYELHHRDFSIDTISGIRNRGKFLALTEEGTHTYLGEKTGIDHLKELGVTHVQLLPSFDFSSVDETKLDRPQYNWGYDPKNYNVPEGRMLPTLISRKCVSVSLSRWSWRFIGQVSGW